jgi:hypothetical protein
MINGTPGCFCHGSNQPDVRFDESGPARATHFTRERREADLQRDTTIAGYGWQTLRVGRHGIGTAQLEWQVRAILGTRTRAA